MRFSIKLRFNRFDALIAGGIVLLAAALMLVLSRGSSGGALTAVISHNGEVVERIALTGLTDTLSVTVGGDYPLTVCADGEGVWVAEAACANQDCVHTGKITRAGESIVCLPDRVAIELTGAGGYDAVLG